MLPTRLYTWSHLFLVYVNDIFCGTDCIISINNSTLVNVYVDLLVFTRIAGTS